VEALTFSKENFQDIFAASPQWTKRLLDSLSTRIQLMIGKLNSIH
jgi:CRP-like cAMP-binding protein